MGMDIYGQNPTSEVGEYFRNNVWWWRPLWEYCDSVAPEVCNRVVYAQSNDGDGLDSEGALELANILTIHINSGLTKKYETEYREYLDSIPKERCELCNGDPRGALVMPHWVDYVEGETTYRYPCNGCRGAGKVNSWQANYPFSEENVIEFRDFLLNSGGFEIH